MKRNSYIVKALVVILLILVSFKNIHTFATTEDEKIKFIINSFFEIDKKANLNQSIEDVGNLLDGEAFLKEVINKYEFEKQWRNKLEYSILTYNYTLKISIKEIKDNRAKAYVERDLEFTMNTSPKTPQKSQNERFIFILKSDSKKWKIIDYCHEEENPDYFDTLIHENLAEHKKEFNNLWENKLLSIESLFCEFKSLGKSEITFDRYSPLNNKLNRDKIKEYAEKYALLRNPMFRDFEEFGGDCTNFISQALYYGGLNQTDDWKPYTYQWIRVRDLRDYLIYNGLAKEFPKIGDNYLGEIVQFSTNNYDSWSHSVIITYKLPNNDYLYCCHSFDKLNYPLSKSYPLIYPKIRVIDLN